MRVSAARVKRTAVETRRSHAVTAPRRCSTPARPRCEVHYGFAKAAGAKAAATGRKAPTIAVSTRPDIPSRIA
jgi:hypothetical protein